MSRLKLILAAGLAAAPALVLASETITYRYDARGRLVKVERSGSVNDGVVTTYTLDKADNRTSKTTTGSGGGPSGPVFSIGDATAAEGGVSHYFTVTRSGDTSVAASVKFNTADGTATGGGVDYYSAGSTIPFAAGETTKTLSIQTVADGIAEGPETFFINLSDPSAGATIADAQGLGTIEDP